MVKEIESKGYDDFIKQIEELENSVKDAEEKPIIFVVFSGTRSEDGTSWCSDCQVAEPAIKEAVNRLKEDDIYIHVEVGLRPEWKDPSCPFRTDIRLRLTCIPTILIWNTEKRLEDSECADETLLEMLLEKDE